MNRRRLGLGPRRPGDPATVRFPARPARPGVRAMSARLLAAALLACTAMPAAAETVAIVNADIVTMGPGGEIARGTIVVRDGIIVAVGDKVTPPAGARIVDAKGGVVTPGLVAPVTSLGLIEVRSIAGSDDRGAANPRVSASLDAGDGLNPDSVLIPVARLGGITRSITVP